ncbi:hypothetical protein FPV67DRAFT_1511604 [Lyophyllum atratum]|nr:hypothetical protein FPV67DRAFT_1511604 [Lyophyllum atratum]
MSTVLPHSPDAKRSTDSDLPLGTEMQSNQLERGSLDNYTEAFEALKSPISRLPADMLAEIFSRSCLNSDDASKLGLVCKAWRDVATSEPTLWTRISLPFPGNQAIRDQMVESVQRFLHSFPHIRLYLSMRHATKLISEFGVFIDRFADRWSNIDFRGHLDPSGLINQLTEPLPHITSLILPNPIGKLTRFPHMPRLQRLQLVIRDHCAFDPQMLILPWKQLTALIIYSCPWSNLLQALDYCDKLKYLRVSVEEDVRTLEECPRLTLELEYFSLSVENSRRSIDYSQALLASIELPAATSITLENYHGSKMATWSETTLTTFLMRAHSLTHLQIHLVPLVDSKLLACLAAVPQLQSLTFRPPSLMVNVLDFDSTLPFLRALEIRDPGERSDRQPAAGGWILPNLMTLTLQEAFHNFCPQSLLLMINSRARANPVNKALGVEPLRKLVVYHGIVPHQKSGELYNAQKSRWLEVVRPGLPEETDLIIRGPSD